MATPRAGFTRPDNTIGSAPARPLDRTPRGRPRSTRAKPIPQASSLHLAGEEIAHAGRADSTWSSACTTDRSIAIRDTTRESTGARGVKHSVLLDSLPRDAGCVRRSPLLRSPSLTISPSIGFEYRCSTDRYDLRCPPGGGARTNPDKGRAAPQAAAVVARTGAELAAGC